MFNARLFLEQNFQTVGGVIAHFRALGLEPPTQGQVEKWFARSALTGEWLAALLSLLEAERGAPVSLAPYMGTPS